MSNRRKSKRQRLEQTRANTVGLKRRKAREELSKIDLFEKALGEPMKKEA